MARMTKAQRSAAAKKAARTRKRNASASTRKRTTRRRTTRKKGLLAEISSVENRNAFRAMVSGAVGGTLYLVYEDQVDTTSMTPEKKGGFALLGAYGLAVMGKKPQCAAGIVGAAAYDFFKVKGLLGDDGYGEQMERMSWANDLANCPVQLSEDEMMYLAQGGDPMDLADYQAEYWQTQSY